MVESAIEQVHDTDALKRWMMPEEVQKLDAVEDFMTSLANETIDAIQEW